MDITNEDTEAQRGKVASPKMQSMAGQSQDSNPNLSDSRVCAGLSHDLSPSVSGGCGRPQSMRAAPGLWAPVPWLPCEVVSDGVWRTL